MDEIRNEPLKQAYAFCRGVARREAKNFFYAFRVLPAAKSDAMCAVYAFMRKADDLADEESVPLEVRRASMQAWTQAWQASRVRPPNDPVFMALRDTQERFGIPDALLDELIAGTTLDLQPTLAGIVTIPDASNAAATVQVYQTKAALRTYCYLVASVVGLVCIRIFGYTDAKAEELAIDTGIAFQLTNILRDVREDRERGRLYLSADLLHSHGLEPEDMLRSLQCGHGGPRELAVLRALEREAQTLYASADRLIPLLHHDAQGAMRVLAGIYRRLLDRIAEDPAAVFRHRVSLSTAEKLTLLAEGGVVTLEGCCGP